MMAPMNLPDLPVARGTYALVLLAETPTTLTIGRLGTITLAPGLYTYVGSAHGPGGLNARVNRHLRSGKRPHWHADYLTAALPVVHVVTAATDARLECTWLKRLLNLTGTNVPAPGLGSSDCRNRCPAHLVRLPDRTSLIDIEALLKRPEQPTDAIQALLDAIQAGDDAATERVAQVCAGGAGRSGLLPALHALLADADADRRWWAVRTLALIGGDESDALLISHLTDSDNATQCAAALGLGQLRATRAIPGLVARLADDSGWVRDAAGDALAMIGEPALPALTQALTDVRDGVRVRAARALRKISLGALAGRQSADFEPQFWPAIAALFTALNDPNRLVRHNAYEALDRLGLLETIITPA
jgi:Uri superfamily endonuclease/HEAT repeat protein